MGVYIKGMEMPRNCGTCRFNYFKEDECSWYSCSLLPSDKDEGSNGADIQDNCPLVGISEPHGRLVEFIEVATIDDEDSGTELINLGDVFEAYGKMREAKPVIEAEGE